MTTIASLSLTTPAMLTGLLLIALPILAHLLYRRARRKIVFPTIRLLQQSVASQSRLYQLRRWILLSLRILAVALIVGAFSRPVWHFVAPGSASRNEGMGLVLLVDQSGSTAQDDGGVQLAHRLRAAGQRVLGSLSPGSDAANIVYATSQPAASLPRLSRNIPMLREELGRQQATTSRANLGAALALAGQQLLKHQGPRRLVVLSDLQSSNWTEVVTRPDAAQLLPPDTQVVIHDVAGDVPHNVALSAPRRFPHSPLLGRPFQLAAQVANFDASPKQVPVEMNIEGQTTATQTVTLAGGERRDVTFEAVLSEPGEYRVRFRISADGLEIDNEAYLVFETRRQLPVMLISDEDPDEPATAPYFVSRALAPYGGSDDHFEIRHSKGSEVTPQSLHESAAVFLVNAPSLDADAAQALCEFIRQGGGVVFFAGSERLEGAVNLLESAAGADGLLPWIPGPIRNPGSADDAWQIDGGRWRSRLLRQFDEQSQIALAEVRFFGIRSAGSQKPDAQHLLTFSDGSPALSSRGFGTGQVVVANWSPDPSGSDFGKHGAFVALIQGLAHELRADPTGAQTAVTGEAFRCPRSFSIPDDADLDVLGPGGAPVRFVSSRVGDEFTVQIRNPDPPGLYEIRRGGRRLASVAANVDARESDLARLDRQTLSACFEQAGVGVAVQPESDWEPLAPASGRPLWPWCLAVAIGCVALELLCLGLWKR